VAQKYSDLVLLLGSRGGSRSRSKSGVAAAWARVQQLVFGQSASARSLLRGSGQQSRRGIGAAWLALGLAVLAFAGGYAVGVASAARSRQSLDAGAGGGSNDPSRVPLRAGVVGELDTRQLSGDALLVAAYEGVAVEDAKLRAKALVDYLRARGFLRAQAFEYRTDKGGLWTVLVYCMGPQDREHQRERLRQLPAEVPDESVVRLRDSQRADGKSWPFDLQIR
jgi:hypothetical protein